MATVDGQTFPCNILDPPRPCASRRVEAPTKQQTLQTLKPLNKPTRGRVYPPPTPSHRHFSLSPWHSWNALRSLDPSKSSGKTNGFSTFSLFGPTKPPHICIILAISCLEAHLFSVLLLFWSLFLPKTTFSSTFSTLGMFLPLCPPQKTFKNQWFFNIFAFGPTKPEHVCIILAFHV